MPEIVETCCGHQRLVAMGIDGTGYSGRSCAQAQTNAKRVWPGNRLAYSATNRFRYLAHAPEQLDAGLDVRRNRAPQVSFPECAGS